MGCVRCIYGVCMYNECTGTWCKYGNAGVERVNMMGVYSTIFFAYVAGNILNILL
jgi:hypothetical protein